MAIDKIFNDANVDGIADNIFGAVNNSVSEVKQMQQRKAAENVQMVVEAFKKIETNITEKFDNVTDVIEKRVLTIKDGRDGLSGSDGRNGRDGKPGRDGVNGKQGIPGTPGKDGVDGVDGVSVTDANIDFDGSLVISLSSGQQINVGEVVSPDLADKIQVISTMSTNGAVGIKDEGTSISSGVKIINFVGANITATNSGDDVTVNVSAGTGTVTSVAATVPAFLSVAGSPITTSGTLAISLSGTALPVANGGTGITSLGTGVATFLGTPSSANLAAAVTDETGTGALVFATSPALVTPALGTPSSGIVTNLTGTASININGTVGATTPAAGAFTTLSATGTLSGGTSGTAYSFSGSAPATSLALDASGQLGVGTSLVGAKLDISYAGGTSANTTLGIKIGADLGNNTSRTVNTRKFASIGGANYSNSAYNIGIVYCDSDSTTSVISIGGGSTGVYDATEIRFVTAATTTSTAGSQKMTLDSGGNLIVGATSTRGTYKLDIRSDTSIAIGANATFFGTIGYSAGSGLMSLAAESGGGINFLSGSTERVRIASTGIVTMSAYGVGTATFSATGVISSVSDETWKIKDGVPVDTDAMLKKLEPGYWYYNDEKKETFGTDRQLGFYAQNVNAAIGPEAAPTPEEGKPWGYYDRSVLAITVMSLQKALATIETLTARITALETA